MFVMQVVVAGLLGAEFAQYGAGLPTNVSVALLVVCFSPSSLWCVRVLCGAALLFGGYEDEFQSIKPVILHWCCLLLAAHLHLHLWPRLWLGPHRMAIPMVSLVGTLHGTPGLADNCTQSISLLVPMQLVACTYSCLGKP